MRAPIRQDAVVDLIRTDDREQTSVRVIKNVGRSSMKTCMTRRNHTHLVEINIVDVVFGGWAHLLLSELHSSAIFVSRRTLYPCRPYAEDFCLAWFFWRRTLDPDFAARDELGELDRIGGGRRAFRFPITMQCGCQRVDWVHLV